MQKTVDLGLKKLTVLTYDLYAIRLHFYILIHFAMIICLPITIKCRLYPTRQQAEKLESALDGYRWVYNYFYKQNLSLEDMQFALTELKEYHPWLRNYHSKMLQMVVHRIDAARKALKVLSKKGRKVGKLKYSEVCKTFVYNQVGFKIERHGNTDLLKLSKIGYVQIRLSIQPFGIKQISVTKKPSGKWFADIVCNEFKRAVATIDIHKVIAIDVGITKFIHDSDNRKVENPKFLKHMLKPLRRADRRISRRQFGSNNYHKAKYMRARLWERIRNKRRDFHHKLSSAYAKKYDLIFVEKLSVQNLLKNRHLARSIIDSGWVTFKSMLEYKSALFFEVAPHYTTIDCSRCGNPVPKSLAVRIHRCNVCGLIINRDYNAAINILQRGLALLGLPRGPREVTPVEIAWQSLKQEENIELVKI